MLINREGKSSWSVFSESVFQEALKNAGLTIYPVGQKHFCLREERTGALA